MSRPPISDHVRDAVSKLTLEQRPRRMSNQAIADTFCISLRSVERIARAARRAAAEGKSPE